MASSLHCPDRWCQQCTCLVGANLGITATDAAHGAADIVLMESGVKPGSDRMEVDQTEGQKASQAILEQKDKRGGGSFKGTGRNGH